MFDSTPPTIFWPLFVLAWLVASIVVGLFVGKVLRWSDTAPTDHVAERQRRIAHNGFKSRAGIR